MAANEPVGSAYIAMRASLAEIQGDMGKISAAVNTFGARTSRALQGVEKSLNNSLGGFLNVRTAVSLLAGGALAATVQRLVAFGDEISDTSRRLNINAQTFQEWRYAVQLSGGEAEDLTKAIEKFQRTIGEIKMGLFTESVTKAQESLGKLGLRLSDLSGLSVEDQFRLVIDRIKAIPDAAQQSSVAFELFGRSAGKIMNTIRGGSEGLREAAEEARRFGLVLSEDTIKKADQANDEFGRMALAVKVAGANLAAEMLPAITRLREIMTSPEFQAAIKVIGAAFNAMFDTTDVRAAVDAAGGIDRIKERIEELTQAAGDNRREADKISGFWADLWNDWPKKIGLQNAAIDLEKEADRLKDLMERFARLPQVVPQPRPPELEVIDRRNEEQIKKALEDLQFRTRVAREEFAALAQGAPEAVHGLGAIGQAALRAYIEGKPLPDVLRKINDAQNKLNAATMHQELLEPVEKYRQEVERLNVLYASGAQSLEDYNRKMFQLRENLSQTSGLAVNLQHSATGIGNAFGTAIDSALVDFNKLHDVAISLLKDIHRALLQTFVTKPITNSITDFLGGSGGLLSGLFGGSKGVAGAASAVGSAKGNLFEGARVIPHAKGGILDRAIAWPMGSSVATAAETHKEAIMPVARGPDGKLGVMSVGGERGGMVVNAPITINAPGATKEGATALEKQMREIPDLIRRVVHDEFDRNERFAGTF